MNRAALLAFVLLLGGLAITCSGGGGKSSSSVDVTLKEWEISVQPAEVKAGTVRFSIDNSGSRVHQFVVVKSDLPPGQLPTTPDNLADLSKLNVNGSVEEIQPGASAELELDLFPGKYVLIDNLVDRNGSGPPDPHYLNGMSAGFFVLEK